jgi:hypothetical protein
MNKTEQFTDFFFLKFQSNKSFKYYYRLISEIYRDLQYFKNSILNY